MAGLLDERVTTTINEVRGGLLKDGPHLSKEGAGLFETLSTHLEL